MTMLLLLGATGEELCEQAEATGTKVLLQSQRTLSVHDLDMITHQTPDPSSDRSRNPDPPDTGATKLFLRPSDGGPADNIQFGVMIKAFYGANFQMGTWSADVVLTERWNDTRATKLLPKGDEEITVPVEIFQASNWQPSIFVTNRDLRGLDVISSVVKVYSDGRVEAIAHPLAIMKAKYDVRLFPFDQQNLTLEISSTTLMVDQLTLSPLTDPNVTGIKDGIFNSSEFTLGQTPFLIESFIDVAGSLTKMRGRFTIFVAQSTDLSCRVQ